MTEIKPATNQEIKRNNQIKAAKKTGAKMLVVVALLGLVGLFLYDLYGKREAIVFAYMNPKQVVQARESYSQELKTAELNYSKNLSRSYLNQ